MTTRRSFLRGLVGTSAAAAGVVGAASGLPAGAASGARVAGPTGTIVLVSLVGGPDGSSIVVPHRDPSYARRRPTIAIGPPGERYGAIDLGGGVGLHPALAPLHNAAGRDGHLAVICGVGVPDGVDDPTSHVTARAWVHGGGPVPTTGWATRLVRTEGLDGGAVWSFGPGPHPAFAGLEGAVADERPAVSLGPYATGEPGAALARANAGSSEVERSARSRLAASARWAGIEWDSVHDRHERGYPDGRLGAALAACADMIRADRGLRIVAVDQVGYDTHVDQGDGHGGMLAHLLDRLARGLGAFWRDVGGPGGGSGVTIVVVGEFGRSIGENDSGGTDHGRGGVALVIGDDAVGGVHGDLPDHGRDDVWPVAVDVRRVIADVATVRGFQPWREEVFAGLALPNRSLGLLLSP